MNESYYLLLAALLFTIGGLGVLLRRNAILVFMSVELMLNSVNLTLVTFSRTIGTLEGQVMAFFVMVVAAAEVVVGLAIIMSIFRSRRSASVDDANLLPPRLERTRTDLCCPRPVAERSGEPDRCFPGGARRAARHRGACG